MRKNHFINRNISILYRYGQKFISLKLKSLIPELEVGQIPFLIQVYRHPGITQDQISANAVMDKGTCARNIKQLESSGFIIREINEKDRRVNHIYPSSKALDLKEKIFDILNDLHKVLYDGFSSQEINSTIKILDSMTENIASYLNKLKYS